MSGMSIMVCNAIFLISYNLTYVDSSVSKVRDLSRIVSSSAYLLFYRRRSDEPLGGPRLEEIVRHFEVPNSNEVSDEEDVESGEGQGLVGISSQHGSSSPFKGAGATPHLKGGLGASKLSTAAKVSPASLEALPAYSAHESNPDAAPTFVKDAIMNDGLHASIEEDEGIGMDSPLDKGYSSRSFQGPYNPNQSTWSFDSMNRDSEPPSGLEALQQHQRTQHIGASDADEDYASDIVDDNSSTASGVRRGRMTEFDEADDGGFQDQSYVPDMDDDAIASGVALQHDIYESRLGSGPYQHVRPVDSDDGMEDDDDPPAAEIHLDDEDDVKLD